MTNSTIYPIILTGGSGSRLWPLSRAALPKQLLPLTSTHSMLQETLLRLDGLDGLAAPILICNHEYRFLVAEQLREINVQPSSLTLEPVGRNTAPAVAVAALQVAALDADALMLVLAADHVIQDVPGFHRAIETAAEVARRGELVTFGVVPDKPETGYGYIQRGTALDDVLAGPAYAVARFVEKPDAAMAQDYLESGDYWWNSGMFVFRAASILEELERLAPGILSACRAALAGSYHDLDFLRLGEESFKVCPSQSIDYAVMEKTERAAVVPISIGWSDVGSFAALWEFHAKDEAGNVSSGEVLLHDAHNCYVNTQKRLVAAVGVDDLVIVETADAVLVAHRDHVQDVKKVVEQLQKQGRTEHEIHRRVYRPWGGYEGVDRGERFLVKRIVVNPGAKLSLQRHYHRSEHWIVVSGTAEVTRGDEVILVTENESIYIPVGVRHRIHNPGHIPLHLIEVQSGSYLSEDDIVRLEDSYGRSDPVKTLC